MKKIFLLITILLTFASKAQKLKEILLVKNADSSLIKTSSVAFDSLGNFSIEVYKDGHSFYVTNTAIVDNTGTGYSYLDDKKEWYCKSPHGLDIYGPFNGKKEDDHNYANGKHMAMVTATDDSFRFYVAGKLVSITAKKEKGSHWFNVEDDCSFSRNGNRMYHAKKNGKYYLYKNDVIIDSSDNEFRAMSINDKGDVLYVKVIVKPSLDTNANPDVTYYIHHNNKRIKGYSNFWDSYLNEAGGVYMKGSNTNFMVNDEVVGSLQTVEKIIAPDNKNYMAVYKKNDKLYTLVNGKNYEVDFDKVLLPSINSKGQFAYYGIEDYYLYKVVNGKRIKYPITKYGVRPVPLYISPEGKSLHLFTTDDSSYLYFDDKLVALSAAGDIKVSTMYGMAYNTGLPDFYDDRPLYVEYDDTGHVFYQGKFSKHMPAAARHSYSGVNIKGEIVSYDDQNEGFYVIQYLGDSKYHININNTIEEDIDGIDKFIGHYFDFDPVKQQLSFVALKNNSLFLYKLNQ